MLNQTLRNSVVKALARVARIFGPVMGLVSKARYNILGYATLESVGPSVHFFGPVTRLGPGTVSLGKQGHVGSRVLFETRENGTIRIGDRFTINRGVVIVARASVEIGNNCLIGEYTSVRDNDHRFDGTAPIIDQGFTTSPIRIEDDVWIGRGCCILKGVHIGKGAVVAANSVVNKPVPAGVVVAGAPAKIVKRRFSEQASNTEPSQDADSQRRFATIHEELTQVSNPMSYDSAPLVHSRVRSQRFYHSNSADQCLQRQRILIVASLGERPWTGGIENVVDTLIHSDLAEKYRFSLLDTFRAPNSRRILPAKLFYATRLFARCVRSVILADPDVVHFHTPAGIDFWKHAVCLVACKLFGRRTLVHVHGSGFDTFYSSSHSAKKFVIRTVFRLADGAIALSEYWGKFLAEVANARKISVIPNPVDCESLKPEEQGSETSEKLILLLGTVGKRKGHYDVLDAIPTVVAQHPRAVFAFAGAEEKPGTEKALRQIADDKGISQYVRFLGPVTGPDKVNLLMSASIMVLPSYAENMPVSILEGMAAGLPVVASTVGAIPECVEEDVTGYLIDPGDCDALAERIGRLLDNPVLARQLGRVGRSKVCDSGDVKSVTPKLDAVYQDLIYDSHRSRSSACAVSTGKGKHPRRGVGGT